ncbi:hypothetical protein V6R21_24335 [Limibacter armeniacum]|uniref:hypothetical protein n=1 Tax=Limibacter armeniacum TaxID=466084 RepID=UPI002FE62CCA
MKKIYSLKQHRRSKNYSETFEIALRNYDAFLRDEEKRSYENLIRRMESNMVKS